MARIEFEWGMTITTGEIKTEILWKREAFLKKYRCPPRYVILSEAMRSALITDITVYPQDGAEYVYGIRMLASTAIETTDDIQVF